MSTTQQVADGMKEEYDRVTEGLKTGPDSSHTREGESTEGLMAKLNPNDKATTSTTAGVTSGLKDEVNKLTSSFGTSDTEKVAQGAKEEFQAATSSGPTSGDSERLV